MFLLMGVPLVQVPNTVLQDVLSNLLEPPAETAICDSVARLHSLGALDNFEVNGIFLSVNPSFFSTPGLYLFLCQDPLFFPSLGPLFFPFLCPGSILALPY